MSVSLIFSSVTMELQNFLITVRSTSEGYCIVKIMWVDIKCLEWGLENGNHSTDHLYLFQKLLSKSIEWTRQNGTLYYIFWGCQTNFHKLGGFKPQKDTVSEFWRLENLKVRCWQSHVLCEVSEEGPSSPLPSFRCLPEILGAPWLVVASVQSLVFT